MRRLRQEARRTGLPMSRIVREMLQNGLGDKAADPLRRFVGVIKGGPPDVSSRKGFSRS